MVCSCLLEAPDSGMHIYWSVFSFICYNCSMSHGSALYIHVPFCRSKCRYCSFVSEQGRQADIPLYVEALKREIRLRAAGTKVTSIYFGGGTPSLLTCTQIIDILSVIESECSVEAGAEISVEANPGTIEEPYLIVLRKAGVNRLSLGIQSLNTRELSLLGRIHTARQGKEAVNLARAAGFDNISVDLIYGLPGQSLESWHNTLEEVLKLGTEHISLYSLTLEPHTPIYKAIEEGRLEPIDPDLGADQYETAEDVLADAGYEHYEISNWAFHGRECHHNLVYWHNLPYIGVGVAAHSCLNGHRLANTGDIDAYLAAFLQGSSSVTVMDEVIDNELELAETMILGLRLGQGINCAAIGRRFGVDIDARYSRQIAELAACGLLACDNTGIRLTRRGRLLANEVFWRFLPETAAVRK